MASETYVTISGPALSLLFFENVKSEGHQIGFLLGSVKKHVTRTLSDGEYHDEKIEEIIHVDAVLPVDDCSAIFTSGKIDGRKLGWTLHSRTESVVGWWTFRYGGVSGPTLKDRIMHMQLSSLLGMVVPHVNQEGLVMAVLGASVSASGATHSSRLRCLRNTPHGYWQPLPTHMLNLGNPAVKTYRTRDATGRRSDAFDSIVTATILNDRGEPDASRIPLTQKHLLNHLNEVACEVVRLAKGIEDRASKTVVGQDLSKSQVPKRKGLKVTR